jgi:hypothetical protein
MRLRCRWRLAFLERQRQIHGGLEVGRCAELNLLAEVVRQPTHVQLHLLVSGEVVGMA